MSVMKAPSLLSLGTLLLVATSCSSLQQLEKPLSGDSGFDPLLSPGASSSGSSAIVASSSPSYKSGQWVETSMPNATFFKAIPRGNARADKVLSSGTPMKVISSKGTYVKVELDSGAVGYVPEIMVIERASGGASSFSNPIAPVPDLGSVPPPITPLESAPPPPSIPDFTPSAPSVPTVPTVPSVPTIPDIVPVLPESVPTIPGSVPSIPDVAPPPEIPGIVE